MSTGTGTLRSIGSSRSSGASSAVAGGVEQLDLVVGVEHEQSGCALLVGPRAASTRYELRSASAIGRDSRAIRRASCAVKSPVSSVRCRTTQPHAVRA